MGNNRARIFSPLSSTSYMGSNNLQSDLVAHAQGFSCPARLILSSFGQKRNFTHYEYRLLLWIPISASAECVEILRQTTVRLAQEVYDRDFRSAVRHDFVFRKEDVEEFPLMGPVSSNNQPVHHCNRALVRPPRNTQTGSQNSLSTSHCSEQDTENLVRQSYIEAQRSKAISFAHTPRKVTVTGVGIARWDPFELQTHHFRKAQLDDKKLRQIRELTLNAMRMLPKSTDWSEYAKKHNFEAESVDVMIVEAFCSDAAPEPNPAKMTTTEFGCRLLERSRNLLSKNQRSAKLAKLLGCAVMCISEYLEGGFKHSAGILNRKMAAAVNEVPGVQKRSRNLARYFCWMTSHVTGWKGRTVALYFLLDDMGRERLYQLFSITNPASAAEMVNLLNKSEYSVSLPSTDTTMDILEIVKYLLRGTVEDRTICNALGCHTDSLAKCSGPPIDTSQDWLQYSLRQMPRHQQNYIPGPSNLQGQVNPCQEPHDFIVMNDDEDIYVESWGEQRPERTRREDPHTTGCEYSWDSGPLEMLSSSTLDADYDPDRGPYNPGELFFDADDPMFEFFDTNIPS